MSDDSDLGGEPACWAHVADELDSRPESPVGSGAVDLEALTDGARHSGDGAIWSLPHGGDLDANLVRLEGGHTMTEHVNDDVDVLVVVWSGEGVAVVDGASRRLKPGLVVLIPRGSRRSITAGAVDLTYLTVHRRRSPLGIRSGS